MTNANKNFSISTIHHGLPGELAKSVLARMHGSMNFRAIAFARMHLRVDALEAMQGAKESRGYKRFSTEPNIDDRNDADAANAEIAQKNAIGADMGFAPMMPAAQLVEIFMGLRDFFSDRVNAIGVRNKFEEPTPIAESINYLIDRAPRDSHATEALAAALEIDPEVLRGVELLNHEQDRNDLIANGGKIITYLEKFSGTNTDEIQAEHIFSELPAQVQYKIIAKIITVYEAIAKQQITKVLRGNMDSAANYKFLKAKRTEAVVWLNTFAKAKRVELAEYVDRGGELPEFDSEIVTSNDDEAPGKAITEATHAASARLKEDNDEREAKAAAKREPKVTGAARRAPAPAAVA